MWVMGLTGQDFLFGWKSPSRGGAGGNFRIKQFISHLFYCFLVPLS